MQNKSNPLSFLFKKSNENKRLENIVRERTLELNKYQKDLEKALDAAKTANSSKSVFLANVSHEIRTPMNSIMGFSELALDGDFTPKTREYIENIRTNAKWLLEIINDILDISKIESGKMELENIPFDLHELFSSCRTLVMPKAVEKGIMLHFYAEPSVGRRPVGDPTRLRQVFVNLLSNAIKFTNAGMVKLHSDITSMTNDTISMHFEIKDSGIGMSSEQIERVFTPFTQAETGTTRIYGGTGLGLPISKNLVEMMGGKLFVESTPGVGSKFSFDLTFNTIPRSEEEMLERKIGLKEIEKPLFKGEILLCEDNIMNQQVIKEHLLRVGIETFVAENGKVGVDTVSDRIKKGEKLFDLVFMDMHMPVIDGLEASAKIRELAPSIPIVAMTANIMADDMDVYKASGMKDCVCKPFTSQELWRCLLKYFTPIEKQESSPDDAAAAVSMPESDAEFQKTLRKVFYNSSINKFNEINDAINKKDIKLAHRLAHTLKGNAGQVGRTELQKAAAQVEHHLRDGINLVTEELFTALKTELDQVLSEFSSEME